MTLHEQIGPDLLIFLDCGDFAEYHDVNGVRCRAVIQEAEAVDDLSVTGTHLGLYGLQKTVFCRTSDLTELPISGQTFRLDGVLYLVDSCAEDMGMAAIKLEANNR